MKDDEIKFDVLLTFILLGIPNESWPLLHMGAESFRKLIYGYSRIYVVLFYTEQWNEAVVGPFIKSCDRLSLCALHYLECIIKTSVSSASTKTSLEIPNGSIVFEFSIAKKKCIHTWFDA